MKTVKSKSEGDVRCKSQKAIKHERKLTSGNC